MRFRLWYLLIQTENNLPYVYTCRRSMGVNCVCFFHFKNCIEESGIIFGITCRLDMIT